MAEGEGRGGGRNGGREYCVTKIEEILYLHVHVSLPTFQLDTSIILRAVGACLRMQYAVKSC